MTNLIYKFETAGAIMQSQYIAIEESSSVEEAIQYLRKEAEGKRNIHYVYVINKYRQLTGVVSIRDLLFSKSSLSIRDISETEVFTLPFDLDQEDVAKIFRDKDLVSMPVVDKQKRLIGVINVDDILDVIHLEADEDIRKLTATGKEIDFHTKPLQAASRRLPWLILLLFIGLISGGIIESFEETLAQVVALAFFMPMIAGMTGNTGTQSLAVVIRGLVSEALDIKMALKLLLREFFVGIIIGIICAIIVVFVASFWIGSWKLGIVVGFSLFCTLIIGTLAGTTIPLVLYKLNADPAVASGPLITTINDILSLLIYFGIATTFIANIT